MPRTGLQVSVLFIVTHGVDLTTEKKSLIEATEQGQALMLEIQRHVFANEGSINKMLVDDKVSPFFSRFPPFFQGFPLFFNKMLVDDKVSPFFSGLGLDFWAISNALPHTCRMVSSYECPSMPH